MKLYTIKFKMDIEEHVPIVIRAEGNDIESLLEDAEYSVDCPDPKYFHALDNLTMRSYARTVECLHAEMAGQDQMRAEAQEARTFI